MNVHTGGLPMREVAARVFRPEASPQLDSYQRSRRQHRLGGAVLGGISGLAMGLGSSAGWTGTLMGTVGVIMGGSLLYSITAAAFGRKAAAALTGLGVAGLVAAMACAGNVTQPAIAAVGGALGAAIGYGMGSVISNRLDDPYGRLRAEEADLARARSDFDQARQPGSSGIEERSGKVTVGGVRVPKKA